MSTKWIYQNHRATTPAQDRAMHFDAKILEQIGQDAARMAWQQGMTVLKPDGDVVPIPLIAEPEIISRNELNFAADEAKAAEGAAIHRQSEGQR